MYYKILSAKYNYNLLNDGLIIVIFVFLHSFRRNIWIQFIEVLNSTFSDGKYGKFCHNCYKLHDSASEQVIML